MTRKREKTSISKNEINQWLMSISKDKQDFSNLMFDLHSLEELENWVLDAEDNQDFKKSTEKLINYLKETIKDKVIPFDTEKLEIIINVFAYIPAGKALLLTYIISKRQPGFFGDLLILLFKGSHETTEFQAEANIGLQRLQIILKMHCFHQIFGKDNRNNVLEIIKHINFEN